MNLADKFFTLRDKFRYAHYDPDAGDTSLKFIARVTKGQRIKKKMYVSTSRCEILSYKDSRVVLWYETCREIRSHHVANTTYTYHKEAKRKLRQNTNILRACSITTRRPGLTILKNPPLDKPFRWVLNYEHGGIYK